MYVLRWSGLISLPSRPSWHFNSPAIQTWAAALKTLAAAHPDFVKISAHVNNHLLIRLPLRLQIQSGQMLWNLHSITPASVLNARDSPLCDTCLVLIIYNLPLLFPLLFLLSRSWGLRKLAEVWGPWAVTEVRQVALEWLLRVDKYGRRTLKRMVGVIRWFGANPHRSGQ